MKVILASASPRRRELLQQVGIEAEVCPADFAETDSSEISVADVALSNAKGKCLVVVAEKGDKLPVVAADTIVVIDNSVLGKPKDAAEAKKMLKTLSGRKHQVITGVAVSYLGRMLYRSNVTEVYFRDLSEAEINAYVLTGEHLDKAGAYGIQGKGALLVERINGCYNNVVGLPLTMLDTMFKELGAK